MSAFKAIRAIDYTVIYVRDLSKMRRFYEDVLHLELIRELSPRWIEYRIGPNVLALALPGLTAKDDPVPQNTAALQLAFRVERDAVDACAAELEQQGIAILLPPTDQPFGHRTLFFRDPDGNMLEIYADI